MRFLYSLCILLFIFACLSCGQPSQENIKEEVQKTYAKFIQALDSGDSHEIFKYLTEEQVKKLTPSPPVTLAEKIAHLQGIAPRDIQWTAFKHIDGVVTLNANVKSAGRDTTFSVEMVKLDNQWKIRDQKMP